MTEAKPSPPFECIDLTPGSKTMGEQCDACPLAPECPPLRAGQRIVALSAEVDQQREKAEREHEKAERRGIDPLLGIATEAVYYEQLPNILRRVLDPSNSYGQPVTFVEVDAIGLKRVNEEVIEVDGQTIYAGSRSLGDQYLQLVVDTILAIKRPWDKVFRTGGDEATIVLPNTNNIEGVMARFRQILNQRLQDDPRFPKELYPGVCLGGTVLYPGNEPLPHGPHKLATYIDEQQNLLLAQVDESLRADKERLKRKREAEGVVFDPNDDRKILRRPGTRS